jgi:hypothetical protein
MNNIKELYLTYPVESLFFELTKDLIIKVDEKEYPNKFFYFKDDNCIFEYNKENSSLYSSYINFNKFFYENFNIDWIILSKIIKDMMEKYFNLSEITPISKRLGISILDERHFNLK